MKGCEAVGMIEACAFGVFALMAVLAAVALLRKSPLASALLGEAAVALEAMCAKNWLLALADSGKDTAMLGFERYPAAAVMLAAIFVAALSCIVLGIVFFVKSKTRDT